jgi:hypothetical protein
VIDPRAKPEFTVSVHGAGGVGKTSLARALVDFPLASDGELARFNVLDPPAAIGRVAILVVRGDPTEEARTVLADLFARGVSVLIAAHARDLDPRDDDGVRSPWADVIDPTKVFVTATPEDGLAKGVEELRATLVTMALAAIDVTVEQSRRAKRPYAIAIISAAALTAAVEGLMPAAAALVITTQVGAITSLTYLYTGRWMGRAQALSMLPMFASEAAGGSVFLLVKSFFPPTGIADVAAAVVSASLTIAILGAVAFTLERGSSLEQKEELREAFRKLRARTVAERAEILRNRGRWRDRSFWTDLVQRLLFEN